MQTRRATKRQRAQIDDEFLRPSRARGVERALLARGGSSDLQRAHDELDRAGAIADERGLVGIRRLVESCA